MPAIQGLVLGNSHKGIVKDGRTLNAMEKAGHFVRKDKNHPYVDEENRPRSFTWNGQNYRIEYFDGCFYPFVCLVN